MLVAATQLRVGMVVIHQNDLHRIMELIHITPGNKRGFVQTKMRNLRSGLQTEYKFRSEEKVDRVSLEQQEMEYLYQSGDEFHFMNSDNYEQITLSKALLGDSVSYLAPNLKIKSSNGKTTFEFHGGIQDYNSFVHIDCRGQDASWA